LEGLALADTALIYIGRLPDEIFTHFNAFGVLAMNFFLGRNASSNFHYKKRA